MTQACEHDPARTYNRFWLGVAFVHAGRPAEAIAPLTTVIDEYPTHGGALYWLGASCHTLGRNDEAKVFLQRAIDSDDVRYVEPATDLLATF